MGARDISDRDYRRLIELLIARRRAAGLTQNDLTYGLKKNQAGISKLERCQRRLDVIDLVRYCDAIGADPLDIMREWLGRG
ncbi:helix-turn-helix domain-containing protein [Oceanibaculum pacificum]|uniref:helix-turn-helix domain-containing protein n=1 Tax=Oceanibaculum pacificum TaxID=580166 RepID=UPI000A039272|nr:helix-turn-helix transcriptional regulator [Oceanibaculum pacificum]